MHETYQKREEIFGLELLRSWLSWRLRFQFCCCRGLMVPDDYGYGNGGYRKAEEQFPEGLWKGIELDFCTAIKS